MASRTWMTGAIEWTRIDGFNQISKYPLADASEKQILQYKLPFGRIDPLVDLMKPVMEFKDDYFVGCDVSPCVFEMYWRLRGMEKTLMEIALNPNLTRRNAEAMHRFFYRTIGSSLSAI